MTFARLDRQLVTRTPHARNVAHLNGLLDVDQRWQRLAAGIDRHLERTLHRHAQQGAILFAEQGTNLAPIAVVEQVSIGRTFDARPQVHQRAHQRLNLRLMAASVWREMSSRIIDQLHLVLYAAAKQLDEAKTVQSKLETAIGSLQVFTILVRPLQGGRQVAILERV